MKLSRQAAFTLIEILVAMAITALIAVSAYAILEQGLNTQTDTNEDDRRLAELQRAMNRIAIDIQMLSDRSVRNEFGDNVPALMGDKNGADTFLAVTRQGKRNPANLPRTELERVHYRLEDDNLMRDQWLVLDIASNNQILERPLLTNVARFEVEFYSNEEWLDTWPQNYNADPRTLGTQSKPDAIRITLELYDYGELRQIYYLRSRS